MNWLIVLLAVLLVVAGAQTAQLLDLGGKIETGTLTGAATTGASTSTGTSTPTGSTPTVPTSSQGIGGC